MTENSQGKPLKYGQRLYDSNPTIPSTNQIAKTRRTRIGNEKRGLWIDEGDEGSDKLISHGGATFYEFEEVDKERFVKLFLAGVKQAIGMSKAGMAVFEMVYDQMRDHRDRDFVLLASRTAPMGERGFQRGLKELLERKFLFRSPNPGLYWVNIQFMFNGNRLAFVKAFQIKGEEPRQATLFDAEAEARAIADEMEDEL